VEFLSAAIMVFTLSYMIHHPALPFSLYSDIVAFYTQRPDFAAGKIPYIEFSFEYPPIAGFLSNACVRIGNSLTGYYNCMSLIIFLFLIGVVMLAYELGRIYNTSPSLVYLLLMPSMLLYLVYNYDIMLAFFILLAIYLHKRNQYLLAGFAIGIGILTKLMSLLLIPVLIRKIPMRYKIGLIISAASMPIAINGILALINYDVWVRLYLHHVEWGLENSWLVNLFQDPNTWDTAKGVSLVLSAYLLLRVYAISSVNDTVSHTLLALNVWLLTTYVYTPQMNLWVLPLYAILGKSLPLLYAYELANALIILTWFTSPNPVMAFSLPQIISTIRAAILLILTLQMAYLANVFNMKTRPLLSKIIGGLTW